MSKKYTKKNNNLPGSFSKWGLFALLMPGNISLNDSGFFVKKMEEEYTAELSQAEMDELFELIEEFDNKNEKDN